MDIQQNRNLLENLEAAIPAHFEDRTANRREIPNVRAILVLLQVAKPIWKRNVATGKIVVQGLFPS